MQLAWKRVLRHHNGTYTAIYDPSVHYHIGKRTNAGDTHGLSVCATAEAALAHDVPEQANRNEYAAPGVALLAVGVSDRVTLAENGKTLVRSLLVIAALDSLTLENGEWVIPLAIPSTRYKHGFSSYYETRGGRPIQYPNAYRRHGWSNMVSVSGCSYSIYAGMTADLLDHVRAFVYGLRRAYPATWAS